MSRSGVATSGLLFTVMALFGYQLFGWQVDGWVLSLVGVVHLAVVLGSHSRLDWFLVWFHYFVTFIALGGVVWVLVDVGATPRGAGAIVLMLFRAQWFDALHYWLFASYVFVRAAAFLCAIFGLSWIVRRRSPRRQELLAGLFVASLLNIPCHFAVYDALSQLQVREPEKYRAFSFAVGILSLDFPVRLHAMVLLLLTHDAWRRRKLSRSHS